MLLVNDYPEPFTGNVSFYNFTTVSCSIIYGQILTGHKCEHDLYWAWDMLMLTLFKVNLHSLVDILIPMIGSYTMNY